MSYPCSENKGIDQLRAHREADLRLCFRICKKGRLSHDDAQMMSAGFCCIAIDRSTAGLKNIRRAFNELLLYISPFFMIVDFVLFFAFSSFSALCEKRGLAHFFADMKTDL